MLARLNLRWPFRPFVVIVGVIAVASFSQLEVQAGNGQPLNVYLSPQGDDAHDGLSPQKPVLTLQHAEELISATLGGKARDVVVHVKAGTYEGQRVRWRFSMPNNRIVIEGEAGNRPIFDGSRITDLDSPPNNQPEWMNIVRRPDAGSKEATNIVIRGLQIQNYLEAIWIHGSKREPNGYAASLGKNIIENNRFVNIGGAYSQLRKTPSKSRAARRANRPHPTLSHGAILISGSQMNTIRRNEFLNISNDSSFPENYSTYGGLHAIYITRFSSGNIIEGNSFKNVFARGVIKFRNFSNFGKVVDNVFYDDTSLLLDAYCELGQPQCDLSKGTECPSWGIEFSNNRYKHYRPPGMKRPTLDFRLHAANDNYCKSQAVLQDHELDPNNALYRIKGVQRVISRDNQTVNVR